MEKVEAVRLALADLGDAPPEQIAAFVSERFGISIETRFIPIFKATVRDRESLERVRQEARAIALAAAAESPQAGKTRKPKKRTDGGSQSEKNPGPATPAVAGLAESVPGLSPPASA